MVFEDLLRALGPEIEDVDEGPETFDIFTQHRELDGLGMLDPKAGEIEITVAGKDFTVKQSPGILNSSQDCGTTGAVLWKTSVAFADWIARPDNVLVQNGLFHHDTTMLELGCGSSGILPHILAPRVQRYLATDQQHLLKTLSTNLDSHAASQSRKSKMSDTNIQLLALDWETSDVRLSVTSNDLASGVDTIIACDCIYNYALIEPFTHTCAEICQMRKTSNRRPDTPQPTLCVVVQHLRQPDVFEQWLGSFMRVFRIWRVPGNMLTAELGEGSEFAVHLAILR